MNKHAHKIKLSQGDKGFYILNYIGLTFVMLIVLYPLVFVISSSFSSPSAILSGRVFLWPVELSIEGYGKVFENNDIWIGYYNSFRYMILGTLINIAATMVAAYPLARKDMPFGKLCMFIFTFTMFFHGGLIPDYMLMNKLNFIDTIWAMILPGSISVWNMILARTFIRNSIPNEILEAAYADGCSDARYFFSFVLPLSKPVIAVIGLYYAIGHWNAYFNAFLYLNERNLYPLQLFLREILVQNSIDPALTVNPELQEIIAGLVNVIKYSLIIVATVPILIIYPFAKRYFVKGVMIGSLKG